VSGVCCARATPWKPYVQAVTGNDCFHLVAPHHILVVFAKALAIHVVEFGAAYARIYLAYILNELDDHFLRQSLLA